MSFRKSTAQAPEKVGGHTCLFAWLLACLLACCSTVFPHHVCLGGRFRHTVGTIELAQVVEVAELLEVVELVELAELVEWLNW